MADEITRKIKIEELVRKFPETVEVLFGFGLHCLGCMGAKFETIEDGLRAHGMGEEEIEEAIKKLNAAIKK